MKRKLFSSFFCSIFNEKQNRNALLYGSDSIIKVALIVCKSWLYCILLFSNKTCLGAPSETFGHHQKPILFISLFIFK